METKKVNMNNKKVPKKKVIGVLRNNENANNNCIDLLHSKRRMEWTTEWLLKRGQFTHADDLLPELRFNEIYYFNNFFKMTEKQFRLLVDKLAPFIVQQEPQRKKKFFSAEERLAITFKYLATGEVHSCRHYCFRASQNVILKMIAEICLKIYETMKDEYIKFPSSQDEWRELSKEFYNEFKLPNCVGALEIRHLAFKPVNKKGQPRDNRIVDDNNTIVLMAIIDHHSNFLYADVGTKSSLDDKDVFCNSYLKKSIEGGVIDLPKTDVLPNSDKSVPNYFAGSYSLPLKSYLMKQFYVSHLTPHQLYFDFKLWDVSQRADNCFEMLTNMFPILMEPFRIDSDYASKITLGCIGLYNFLRKTQNFTFDDEDILEKTSCLLKMCYQNQEKDETAITQRSLLMDYLNANRKFEEEK